MVRVSDVLGRVGLPLPTADLAARTWDVVVVGAGHNGLTAAAYLARAGRSVLVLERAHQVGGAATLTQPFEDPRWLVSPCAYMVGLLHSAVIDELELRRHGFRVHLADPHLWCPFEDGTALGLSDEPGAAEAAVAAFNPADVDGYLRYSSLFARCRAALRQANEDTWLGDAPDRDRIEALLGHDPELVDLVFRASIAELLEAHVADDRIRAALHGQGVIGTYAGPRDEGTAMVHLMHTLGTMEGVGGAWGYVEGGMGQVSFALAEAAIEHGTVIATGVPVGAIDPGAGVTLDSGEEIRARTIVCNADPTRMLGLVTDGVPADYRARLEGWRSEGQTVKLNLGLSRLPRFTADPDGVDQFRGMITVTGSIDDTQAAFERSTQGQPAPEWAELYFHTAHDPSIAPPGKHACSVFAQYAPYTLADGDWETRREEIGDAVIARIARVAPDLPDVVEERQVLGPPDIEATVGLTGGHIFQGDCLPGQMWDRRLSPRTPIPDVYLCGAATHPGGSVIGANGRNAAMAVLADTGDREAVAGGRR